jgi:hypothetical protein
LALKGSCLCGTVRYEVDQLDMPIGHCHCTTCRKAHASAFTSTAGVMREHFRWTQGQDALRAFESSPGKLRLFCGHCGTHLIAERLAQPHVILRVATLDDDPGSTPAMHIWTSQDASWLQDQDGVPHYPEWQPSRWVLSRKSGADQGATTAQALSDPVTPRLPVQNGFVDQGVAASIGVHAVPVLCLDPPDLRTLK